MPPGKFRFFNFRMFWQGSTLQLLGVIILPLALLVLVFALGSTWLHQRAMREMVGERDELAVKAAAGALSTEIHHRIAAMRGLVLRAVDSDDIDQEMLASYGFLAPDFDLGLAIFSIEDGLIVEETDSKLNWEGLASQSDFMDFIQRSTETGELTEWTFDNLPVILVSASSPDRELVAVGGISAETLAGHIVTNVLPGEREARVFIVNKEHQVVYQSGSSGNGVDAATHPGVNEALKGSSGTLYMQDRGIEHVVSYSDVQPLGWALVMEEPWQAVATPILTTTQIAPLVLVPLLLITLAGLWFGASQIVQPLRELEKRSARLAWGDFQSVNEEVGGIAEIRQLQAELAQMARKVQAAQSSLHEYIGEITEAQEDERLRLARELHDGTLQSLIALKQRVQMVQKSREETSDNQELNTLAALVEQTIEDVRRTTRALRPIYLEDLGLVTALEMLAREAEESSGIKIAFSNHGNERRLPSSIELALYRMAQEALSNVARHSRASQAALNVQFEPNNLQLEIKDNGNGFQVPESPGELAPQGHFGLLGLYERAELIGANLVINSKVGEGTRLVIGLPIQQK